MRRASIAAARAVGRGKDCGRRGRRRPSANGSGGAEGAVAGALSNQAAIEQSNTRQMMRRNAPVCGTEPS